ncbi:hypothetical protein NBRC10512_002971 [Rhodotorula toruloides]|uniref:RHTO0S17e02388g1_1 n=2 Tax=Rhodotorula toruloides TaxID=5286 RepID=A0A061BKB7_RHOTO|nr:uncharacterized protein RHTO_03405 [Rhodotorula toruloides NP11]EMS20486.1 hypothetical protein RHTO_03405 [Rhodotorula toruloides NP11]CDR48380.1 RHTO0S17e02388g1_1 [Rhodotorula toruloides]
MTVTIPVELQQYILELAIPPLIQPSLNERVRLCKTFSLVHRAWTPIAQRELREHCGISLDGVLYHEQAAQRSLLAATRGGWAGKRLELRVSGITALNWRTVCASPVEELWLTCVVYRWVSVPHNLPQTVKKLHCAVFELATTSMTDPLYNFPALEYLHLRRPTRHLDCLSMYPFASTLTTLLIDGAELGGSLLGTVRDWQDLPLRVLFFATPNRVLNRQELLALPPTLQHFAYLPGTPAKDDPSAKYDFATPPFLTLPKSLRSMTFVTPQRMSIDHDIARSVLKVAAKNVGARFTVVAEEKHGKRFSAEEWAISVGA